MAAVMPPDDLKARVLASVRCTPAPTRDRTRRQTTIVVVGAAVIAACLYMTFGGADHGQGRPPNVFVASMSVWIVAALVSVWAAVGKGRASMGRPGPWLFFVAAGTPLLILLAMLALSVAVPVGDETRLASLQRPGARCFAMTIAAALLPLVALLVVRRGSDAVHPAAHGAAIGAAFGAYAGVMVCLWCPDVSPIHIMLGHVAPLVLLSLVGAAVGGRVLALGGRSH
jgi:hypothetical protein